MRRRALLAGLAVGTAGVAGCGALAGGSAPEPLPSATPGPADWPASGYDATNRRYNPDAAVARTEPTARWTREFRSCHEPFVRGDRVVLNADNRMLGLRTSDGEPQWRSASEPWGFETPVLGAERAYVTGTDCVFGVDLETGEETWHGRPCHGANTASPTLADGRLYLEYGGYFSALDATGQVTWASRHDARGSPAVDDEMAYVATAFTVEAVDLTAAAREWPWEDRDDDEPPHADREAATAWSVPPEKSTIGPRIYRSPAVTDDTVYATFERDDRPGGELRALARDTGDERWSVASPPEREVGEPPRDGPEPVGSPVAPVVTDELVVTALGDRHLRAFTHGGDGTWTEPLDREVTDLVGAGDTLLAVTHDRSVETTASGHAALAAFDRQDGSRLWSLTFPDHVEGLAVAGESVYATVVTDRRSDGSVDGMRLLALG